MDKHLTLLDRAPPHKKAIGRCFVAVAVALDVELAVIAPPG
ncbi:hypothetical protein P5W98_03450 [Paraburkholderia sp. A1BS-2L]